MIHATERLIPLRDAARRFPRPGTREGHVGYPTIRQWTRTGCNGVVLESVKLGRVYTSEEAIERFLAATQGRALAAGYPAVSADAAELAARHNL